MRERSLIIVGMGKSRSLCTFDADEVWTVNNGFRQINMEFDGRVAHIEKIFLAHTQVIHPNGNYEVFDWNEMNRYADTYDIEIINTHRVKGLNSKLYPIQRISDKFDAHMFFSDTIAYMVAYALDLSTTGSVQKRNLKLKDNAFTTIKFFGVDMMQDDEYMHEKGGIEFFIGVAKGLCIDFFICEGGTLLTTVTGKPYGQKYFNLKDIDPTGLLKRKRKKKKGDKMEIVLDDRLVRTLTPEEIQAMTEGKVFEGNLTARLPE